jgi:hypothetical protein
MEIFDIGPGVVLWSLLSGVFLVLIVGGIVLTARFFVRLSRVNLGGSAGGPSSSVTHLHQLAHHNPTGGTVTGNASVEQARELASRLHAAQVDKLGEPYIGHCERVAARLDDDDAKVVALLHDVLEDTGMPESELRATFGDRIVDAVVLLTRTEGIEPQAYYARIREAPLALSVKLADIHDNLDPARLSKLDAETASRLLRKYGASLLALGSE